MNQIARECDKFGKASSITCNAIFGGVPKGPQVAAAAATNVAHPKFVSVCLSESASTARIFECVCE
jgi:hypothetical protein